MLEIDGNLISKIAKMVNAVRFNMSGGACSDSCGEAAMPSVPQVGSRAWRDGHKTAARAAAEYVNTSHFIPMHFDAFPYIGAGKIGSKSWQKAKKKSYY